MTFETTIVYYAQDDLSKTLAASIPKKVNAWLANIGMQVHGGGQFGRLRWNFDLEAGTILFGQDGEADFFQLWYQGDPLNAKDVCTIDSRFENLSHDLEYMTLIEKNIYGELEKLQKELTEDEPEFKLPAKE